MKFKLTPEISYVIGVYGQRKTEKGIGIYGDDELLSIFSKECLKLELAEPGKILFEKNKVYFYNSKLKRFFEKVLNEVEDRFIFVNDYASNYFAGMYDAYGKIEDKEIIVGRYRLKDSIALEKLGFINRKKNGKIQIETRKLEFLYFIKPNLRIKKKEVENIIKQSGSPS